MLKPDRDGHYRLTFLLLPGYTMTSLQTAIDVLSLANKALGRSRYSWQLLSLDGQPVAASNGLMLAAEHYQYSRPYNLLLCAGSVMQPDTYPALQGWLQMLKKRDVLFGAFGSANYLLAQAGILSEGSIALCEPLQADFQHAFPTVEISSSTHEVTKNYVSCVEGPAAGELMLRLIQLHCSTAVRADIARQLGLADTQVEGTGQEAVQVQEPRLRRALSLMQSRLDSPLSSPDLAEQAHLSVRQLERLFKRYLQITPGNHYLKIRLNHARQLIHTSPMDIGEIAAACGFCSGSHFSRTYRRHFGVGPREDRQTGSDFQTSLAS